MFSEFHYSHRPGCWADLHRPVPGEILNRRDLTFDEDSGWGPWLVTGLAQSESFKGGPDPWPDSHEWLRDTKSSCPQKNEL